MTILKGYISEYDGQALTVIAPFEDGGILERQQIHECEIYLHDGRQLSPDQRNKIFALVGDITEWMSGFDRRKMVFNETLTAMQLNYLIEISPETVRRQLTQNYCRLNHIDLFSLAARSEDTIDMSTARDFIDWLVELCVINGIPCMDTLLNRCEDIGRYLYACVANRRCAICGGKADIHEVDRVGNGRNRRQIHHLGQRVQPLCRRHHDEVDAIGQQSFDRKYNVTWIKLDEHLCDKLKWRK